MDNLIQHNPFKPIKGWYSGDLAMNVETKEIDRVNPHLKSNRFDFTVPGHKAKSFHVDKLGRAHRKDGCSYTLDKSQPLSENSLNTQS